MLAIRNGVTTQNSDTYAYDCTHSECKRKYRTCTRIVTPVLACSIGEGCTAGQDSRAEFVHVGIQY